MLFNEMLQIPFDEFSFRFYEFEQAAEYTEILISKNKNIAFLAVSVGYSLIPTRGRCTVHRRPQPTIGLIPSTETQKQMYSSDQVGMAHVRLVRAPSYTETTCSKVPAQSPVTCVAWPSEVWLVDWMNMGWVMSWPAGMVTCWI